MSMMAAINAVTMGELMPHVACIQTLKYKFNFCSPIFQSCLLACPFVYLGAWVWCVCPVDCLFGITSVFVHFVVFF